MVTVRGHRRLRRRGAALALAVTTALVTVAGAAHAAPTRHEGGLTIAMGEWCDLGYQAATAGSVAGVIYDDAAPPAVGEVFYAYVEVAATAEPCIEQQMVPDIKLPPHLQLAVSASTPIRCVRWDYASSPTTEHPDTASCPTGATPGVSGGEWSFPTRSGDLWRLPYQTGWEVQVPVVATAPGATTVSFYSQLIDGVTNPVLRTTSPAVTVRPGATTAGSGSGPGNGGANAGVSAQVSKVVRLGRTGGDVPAKVVARPAGSRIKATLRVRSNGRWHTLAKRTAEATGTRQTLSLPVPASWRGRLPNRGASAHVVVLLQTGAGGTERAADSFTLKP